MRKGTLEDAIAIRKFVEAFVAEHVKLECALRDIRSNPMEYSEEYKANVLYASEMLSKILDSCVTKE